MAFDAELAVPRVRTRTELLQSVAKMFDRLGLNKFNAIEDLERDDQKSARAMSTLGTVLEPVVEHLNAIGVPTDPTVGSLMAVLDLEQHDVHDLACYCLGPMVTGIQAGERTRVLIAELAD